ncbi:MAG: tRNA (adenosine(37)-N6)-dimethylallyltransferase MiaA, partial [Planctomycetes bacterium]|nr:tRNA (adenosine(37)-N6)-dimethylallyltransferase MiaA [Planctomycetota bacterium]
AGGKSELAMRLAAELPGGGEIVCADSMQVWRGMDVGTAKPTAQERARVPHHALDLADPHRDRFTAADWLQAAHRAIADIRRRGGWPIVVGGTNLYLRLLMEGMTEHAKPDPALRAELDAMDTAALRAELERVDPASAALLHPNDRRRAIRAIEILRASGVPASQARSQWSDAAPAIPSDMRLVGLQWSTAAINARINERVQRMISSGWQREVHDLLNLGPLLPQPLEAVGYRELSEAAEGRISLAVALEAIKVRTRHYAKQQRTWLRKFSAAPGTLWIEADHAAEGAWSRQVLDWLEGGSRTIHSPSST